MSSSTGKYNEKKDIILRGLQLSPSLAQIHANTHCSSGSGDGAELGGL